MNVRNKTALRIAQQIQVVKRGECDAETMLYHILIDTLPPINRRVYNYVAEFNLTVTSADIEYRFGWKINYASTVLNELWKLGLLARELVTDEDGKRYAYKLGWKR